MSTTIRLRRDTAADWTAANPILDAGEPGIELVTGLMKIGDGVTTWNNLPYLYDPAVADTASVVPIAGRTFASRDQGATNQSNGTDTQMHTRAKHLALSACMGIEVVYGNSYNFGGTPTNNTASITVRAGLETAGGLFYPVWFPGGKRDALIEAGGFAVGWCGMPLAQGDLFFSRTKVSVTAGQKWPIGLGDAMNGTDEGAVGTTSSTDLTLSGSITANTNDGYYPWAIFGKSFNTDLSIIAIGDSITAGKGDTLTAGKGAGWIARVMPTTIPWLRAAPMSGETAGQWTAAAGANIQRLIAHPGLYNRALSAYGINDVTGGQTLVAMQGRLQSVWAQLKAMGCKVYQTTLTPVSTSTDSWATTVNQTTAASNAVRIAVNDWIRTVPAGLDDVIEVADIVETARNSGIWKAANTSDGTHPNATGHAAIAAAVNISGLTS